MSWESYGCCYKQQWIYPSVHDSEVKHAVKCFLIPDTPATEDEISFVRKLIQEHSVEPRRRLDELTTIIVYHKNQGAQMFPHACAERKMQIMDMIETIVSAKPEKDRDCTDGMALAYVRSSEGLN